MKLVAEQVKLLREKKKQLLEKKKDYLSYCASREKESLEGIGLPFCSDYQEETKLQKAKKEYQDIHDILVNSDYVTGRNFDQIDVGTKFTIAFDDDDKVEAMLTESNPFVRSDLSFVSLESDLGQAVYGKKVGDHVSYQVKATGKTLSVTIDEIDSMKDHYEHYLEEVPYTSRCSTEQRKMIADERIISSSQAEIIHEEFLKLNHQTKDRGMISRKSYLKKLLREAIVAHPEGLAIGVGSKVCIALQNEDGEVEEKTFEFINRAYSTELASEYVERTSSLGRVIYGLKSGEEFTVRRKNMPSLKGIVLSVENENNKERVR